MRKYFVLFAVLGLAALLVFGCQKSDYATGYAAYGQQNPQQQPYVGGGCGVAPVSDLGEPLQISGSSLAA